MKRAVLALSVFLVLSFVVSGQQNPAAAPATPSDSAATRLPLFRCGCHQGRRAALLRNDAHARNHASHHGSSRRRNGRSDARAAERPKSAARTRRQNCENHGRRASFHLHHDLLKAIEPVIQKNYTQRELRALIAFYSTPDGQSIQKKQPTVTAETMRVTSAVIQQLQQDLVARIQEELIKAHEQQQDHSKELARRQSRRGATLVTLVATA